MHKGSIDGCRTWALHPYRLLPHFHHVIILPERHCLFSRVFHPERTFLLCVAYPTKSRNDGFKCFDHITAKVFFICKRVLC